MSKLREAAQDLVDDLTPDGFSRSGIDDCNAWIKLVNTLRAALAEPEPDCQKIREAAQAAFDYFGSALAYHDRGGENHVIALETCMVRKHATNLRAALAEPEPDCCTCNAVARADIEVLKKGAAAQLAVTDLRETEIAALKAENEKLRAQEQREQRDEHVSLRIFRELVLTHQAGLVPSSPLAIEVVRNIDRLLATECEAPPICWSPTEMAGAQQRFRSFEKRAEEAEAACRVMARMLGKESHE
jgi:hypothetical protein